MSGSGNYERMQESARLLFQNYDPEKLCRRLALPRTPEGIPIRYLGEEHLVRLPDGEVLDSRREKAPPTTALTIYDVLCRTETTPLLRGRFVPTMELHGIMGSNSVHENLNEREAAFFSGKGEALAAACRRRGGVPGERGDVAFILPVFDFFPVQLRFWEADEEFPAQLQFFWDAGALDFLHYETLWYVMGDLTARLRRELQ